MGYQLIHLPPHPQEQLFATIVHKVPGALLHHYQRFPWMLLAPILGFAGALLGFLMTFTKKTTIALWGSIIMIVGTILTFGFSLFPFGTFIYTPIKV